MDQKLLRKVQIKEDNIKQISIEDVREPEL